MENNLVGWFEIPVTDMKRAKNFYEKVFEIEITVHDLDGFIMGWFPYAEDKPGTGGSLVQHEMYTPDNKKGCLLYFGCENLDNELKRVEANGGKIIKPKTAIGNNHGFMALFLDSENNRIALHSLM